MPQVNETPDTVCERVGKLEQKAHTHEFRLGVMEELRPRVTDLERTVESMSVNMINLQKSQQELKDTTAHGFKTMSAQLQAVSNKIIESVNTRKGEKAGSSRTLTWVFGMATIFALIAAAVLWGFDGLKPGVDIVGVSAQCNDGSYSISEGRGTCSHRGGVKRWLD